MPWPLCSTDRQPGRVGRAQATDDRHRATRTPGVPSLMTPAQGGLATIDDIRFTQPLYTVPEAARLVGMSPSTLETWAHGYERRPIGRPVVRQGPVITSVRDGDDNRTIPFIGLVEATVVQAFRRSQLSMQRIRRALEVLADQGELQHALASRSLFSDGANVLYDYARREGDGQLRLLTVVSSGQVVFHDLISEYLSRIAFGDRWATEMLVPVTERPLLRVRPTIAGGDPLFVSGGAPLSAVHSRFAAGEPAESLAEDYGVPVADINEAIGAIWPHALAA